MDGCSYKLNFFRNCGEVIKKKRKELKIYQIQLHNYREYINQVLKDEN
jgi:hypothetical protein